MIKETAESMRSVYPRTKKVTWVTDFRYQIKGFEILLIEIRANKFVRMMFRMLCSFRFPNKLNKLNILNTLQNFSSERGSCGQ